MSQSHGSAPPYHVVYSAWFRAEFRQLLERARVKGRFAEVVRVAQEIHTRLEWIPLDFGEPLRNLVHLGIQTRLGTVPPLVLTFGVDEARRIVYVSIPFRLLSGSGL